MRIGIVLHLLGRLCVLLAGLLAVPWLLAVFEQGVGSPDAEAFLLTMGIAAACGFALRFGARMHQDEFGFAEAFGTVTTVWLVFMLLGALPFVFSGAVPGFLDACFETLSGFTTTGASILDDPARIGRPLLLWRALTHWVGGMGIVALSVAILPALGAGGNVLFQAETAGPESEKLLPRISSTAKLLWGVYVMLTAAQVLAYRAAGMSLFDAVCHSFATVATGGFGTRADSMASFSPLIQWITVVFMLLAGMNFVLLLKAVRGQLGRVFANTEVRVYFGLFAAVSALVIWLRWSRGGEGLPPEGFEGLVRGSVFSVVSLGTTTGFATVDFDLWPIVTHPLLMLVMFTGACAGSTSGASKIIRVVLWWKHAVREVLQLLHPRAVLVVKVGGRRIPDVIIDKSTGFLVLYLLVLGVGAFAMMWIGLGAEAGFSSVLTCLSGVGPGFGEVGPTHNFAQVPATGKLLLMGAMLLGRLEFYSMFVLLSPLAWKR